MALQPASAQQAIATFLDSVRYEGPFHNDVISVYLKPLYVTVSADRISESDGCFVKQDQDGHVFLVKQTDERSCLVGSAAGNPGGDEFKAFPVASAEARNSVVTILPDFTQTDFDEGAQFILQRLFFDCVHNFKTKEQLVTQKVRSQTRPTERLNNPAFIPYERSHRMDAFLLAMHRRRHEIEQPPQELVNLIFEFDHYLDH